MYGVSKQLASAFLFHKAASYVGGGKCNEGVTRKSIRRPPLKLPNNCSLFARILHGSLVKSLQRLGLPYVDSYYVHRLDGKTPIERTIRAMLELKNEGINQWIAAKRRK